MNRLAFILQLTFFSFLWHNFTRSLPPGVLLGDSLGGLVEAVLSREGAATADGGVVVVQCTLTSELRSVRVNGGLAGRSADTLRTTHAGVLAAGLAVVVNLLAGLALDGLAEASVDLAGVGAAEGLRGGGLVVAGLGRSLLGVAGEGLVRRCAAGGKSLCVELGDGVVASQDTRLVLGNMLAIVSRAWV